MCATEAAPMYAPTTPPAIIAAMTPSTLPAPSGPRAIFVPKPAPTVIRLIARLSGTAARVV